MAAHLVPARVQARQRRRGQPLLFKQPGRRITIGRTQVERIARVGADPQTVFRDCDLLISRSECASYVAGTHFGCLPESPATHSTLPLVPCTIEPMG